MPSVEKTSVSLTIAQKIAVGLVLAAAVGGWQSVMSRIEANQQAIQSVATNQSVYIERMEALERMIADRTKGLYPSSQAASDLALRDEKLAQLKASVAELRADLSEHVRNMGHTMTMSRLAQIDQQIIQILQQIDELKKGGR